MATYCLLPLRKTVENKLVKQILWRTAIHKQILKSENSIELRKLKDCAELKFHMSNVSADLRLIYKVKGTQEIHNLLSLPYINFQVVKYLNKALPSLLFSIFRKLNMKKNWHHHELRLFIPSDDLKTVEVNIYFTCFSLKWKIKFITFSA